MDWTHRISFFYWTAYKNVCNNYFKQDDSTFSYNKLIFA